MLYLPRFYVPVKVVVQSEQPLSVDEECDFVDAVTAAVENEEITQQEAGDIIDREYHLERR